MKTESSGTKRIVVLDASTLVYDPQAPRYYADAEIHIADCVIEQLAEQGGLQTEFARNAREALEALAARLSLSAKTNDSVDSINVVVDADTEASDSLALAALLQSRHADAEVRLISRDAGVRIRAAALGIVATNHLPAGQDSSGNLHPGFHRVSTDTVVASDQTSAPVADDLDYAANELVVPENGMNEACIVHQSDSGVLSLVKPQAAIDDAEVWGISGRNDEQRFALWLLMNPDIDLVSLEGDAGTGKTLLALAAGLNQTLEQRRFIEVIVTRATIAIGQDIGFLPGTEEEKMTPWMGAIEDNLEVLLPQSQSARNNRNWGKAASRDLIGTRIRVKSINFMRGRTFSERFIIIDEAQNLTPFQMKTLLTRAGPGTKVVLLGNLAQIDTPWLDPGTSGFSWAVARMRHWQHSGHVTLAGVERSRLASHAVEAL